MKELLIKQKGDNVVNLWEDTEENRLLVEDVNFNLEIYDGEIEEHSGIFYVKGTYEKPKTQKELFTDGIITGEDYSNYIKSERDSILSSMDKYSIMHQEGVITDEQYEKVKKFKDYLRGIPQIKGFPKTFTDFEVFEL